MKTQADYDKLYTAKGAGVPNCSSCGEPMKKAWKLVEGFSDVTNPVPSYFCKNRECRMYFEKSKTWVFEK